MPMTSERDFELAFAELAFSAMQDRAPSLVPRVLGFQSLDSSEDQAHAVGVFAADVAGQRVFVPVFFHGGEIKGLELMYLSEQDLFVPLRENWMTYLAARKPTDLGDAQKMPREELGRIQYSLQRMRRGPSASKYGSAVPRVGTVRGRPVYTKSASPWDHEIAAMRGRQTVRHGGGPSVDLVEFLAQAPAAATTKLAAAALANPAVCEALTRHYGENGVRDMVLSASFRRKLAAVSVTTGDVASLEADKVLVTNYRQLKPHEGSGLSAEQRAALMRGEVIVDDKRNATSRTYRGVMKAQLTNPAGTGVYLLPTVDGMLRCFVGQAPIGIDRNFHPASISHDCGVLPETQPRDSSCSGPYRVSYPDQRREPAACLVVNLEGSGACVGIMEALLVSPQPASVRSALGNRLTELTDLKPGQRYALADDTGNCTTAFTVVDLIDTADGGKLLTVNPVLYPRDPSKAKGTSYPCTAEETVEIDLLPIGGAMFVCGKRLLVPTLSAFAVRVEAAPCEYNSDGYPSCDWKTRNHGGLPRVLSAGQLEIALRKSPMIPLAIHAGGTEYEVSFERKEGQVKAGNLQRVEAAKLLCCGLGVRGEDALALLDEADRLGQSAKRAVAWVDLAPGYPRGQVKSGYYMPPIQPNPGEVDELGMPAITTETAQEAIPGLEAADADHSGYDLSRHVGVGAPSPGNPGGQMAADIAQAAVTGEKDIFDTAAIGALLKSYDASELVDRYLSDVILGMDRVGRIYFVLLKHYDQFRDRYGAQDAITLEDSLRNAFRIMGDLVMDLKERDVGAEGRE